MCLKDDTRPVGEDEENLAFILSEEHNDYFVNMYHDIVHVK